MKLMIFILAVLVMAGCSVSGRDLSLMPKYDYEKATSQWEMIDKLDHRNDQLKMEVMMSAMAGGQPSEEQIESMKKSYDEFLYWRSVAAVEIFHSDPEKAEIAVHRANLALEDIEKIVGSVNKLIGAVGT